MVRKDTGTMLTDNEIRRFDSPKNWPKKRLLLSDRGGLALDVMPSGIRSWVYRYRRQDGSRMKMTLGRYPDLNLKAARDERDKLAGQVARGESPADQRQKEKFEQKEREEGRGSDPTLSQFTDRWYRELVLPPKGRNYRQNPKPVRGCLDNQILPVLGDKLLKEVTKADIRKLLFEKRNAGYEAAALLHRQILKMVFDYAVVEELLEFNPVLLIPKDSIGCIKNRERDLSDAEVRSVFETIAASSMARSLQIAVRILLLTMVRKGELQRARWEHFDYERGEWHIPREHSKTGRPHIVPLAPQVAALFRELQTLACGSVHVLPSRQTIKKALDLSTLNHALRELDFQIPHFTVHDLRRTAATRCAEGGFPGDVIERALNHARQGIRGVYNRSELLEQRREMLCWWANRVDALTSEPKLVVGAFKTA
jgi:integrase